MKMYDYDEDVGRVTKACFFLRRWWALVVGWVYWGSPATPEELEAWAESHSLRKQLTNLELLHATEVEALKGELHKSRLEIDRLTRDVKIAEDEREASKAGLELLAETLERYRNLEAMKSVLYRRRAGIDQPRNTDL